MDTLAPALIVVALLLMAMEIVVPGGVMGTISVLCLLGATADIWVHYGSGYGILALAGSAILTLALFIVELRFLRKGPLAKWFCLERQTAPAKTHSAEGIQSGCEGKTLTRLNPSGLVLIDGRQLEAISRDGLVEADTDIVVVGDDPFRIVVERKKR